MIEQRFPVRANTRHSRRLAPTLQAAASPCQPSRRCPSQPQPCSASCTGPEKATTRPGCRPSSGLATFSGSRTCARLNSPRFFTRWSGFAASASLSTRSISSGSMVFRSSRARAAHSSPAGHPGTHPSHARISTAGDRPSWNPRSPPEAGLWFRWAVPLSIFLFPGARPRGRNSARLPRRLA